MTSVTPCFPSRRGTRERHRTTPRCRQRSLPCGTPVGSSWSSTDIAVPGSCPADTSKRANPLVRRPRVNFWKRAGRSPAARCSSSATRGPYWHPTSALNTRHSSQGTARNSANSVPTRRSRPSAGGISSKFFQDVFSPWTPTSPRSHVSGALPVGRRPVLAAAGELLSSGAGCRFKELSSRTRSGDACPPGNMPAPRIPRPACGTHDRHGAGLVSRGPRQRPRWRAAGATTRPYRRSRRWGGRGRRSGGRRRLRVRGGRGRGPGRR